MLNSPSPASAPRDELSQGAAEHTEPISYLVLADTAPRFDCPSARPGCRKHTRSGAVHTRTVVHALPLSVCLPACADGGLAPSVKIFPSSPHVRRAHTLIRHAVDICYHHHPPLLDRLALRFPLHTTLPEIAPTTVARPRHTLHGKRESTSIRVFCASPPFTTPQQQSTQTMSAASLDRERSTRAQTVLLDIGKSPPPSSRPVASRLPSSPSA